MKSKHAALLISSLLLLQSYPAFAQSFGQLKNAALEAQSAKKYDEALSFWKKALEACEDKTGPRYMQSLSGLASCYADQEKYADADESYKKFVELCKADALSDDSKTALVSYAKVLRKQNRETDAAALDAKFALTASTVAAPAAAVENTAAIAASKKAAAKDADAKLWQTLSAKAAKELSQKQYPQAEQSYKQALALAEKQADSNLIAQTLSSLVQLHLAQNKSALAEPLLQKSAELARKSYGGVSREYARALNEHADLLRKLNRKPEAMAEEARAESILAKILPSSSGSGGAAANSPQGNAAGTRSGSIYSRAKAAQGLNSNNSQSPEE